VGLGGKIFSKIWLRIRMFVDRISHSTLFAGPDQKPHKGRFAYPHVRVPVDRDHRFRWKMITQSGGT
jgi:hypothetical protein